MFFEVFLIGIILFLLGCSVYVWVLGFYGGVLEYVCMASMVYRVVVGRFVGLVVVLKDRFFIGDYVLL